ASGTVAALGTWVLGRALADLRAWRDAGHELRVAVTLSAAQLQQSDLFDEVVRLLELHGVEPGWLRLEVSEPALLSESEFPNRAVRAFAQHGIEVAIDNFGTGYSSLGLVRGLPVRVVKIDKSLVSHCPSRRECAAIVQAAASMSRALGIRVVAAGVETEEQREAMAALGCDAMQGYLVARPMDSEGIVALMRTAAEQTQFA
ncbi:MAG TPA: EAL domain-containing protein, partial [Myxococcota bacterium]|nr:EAL domain-containing protein [Myxococcota bacterium]